MPPNPHSVCSLSSTEFVEPLLKKIPGYTTGDSDCSIPSSTKDNNIWSYTSIPHMPFWHGVLISTQTIYFYIILQMSLKKKNFCLIHLFHLINFIKQCSKVWQSSVKCKRITNEKYQQVYVQVVSSNVCSVILGLSEALHFEVSTITHINREYSWI